MARRETSDNQPKRRSRGWILFLVLILLLAGGAGYLYYSAVKAPVELDDPKAMAASVPMAAEERFRVSAADGTVQVRLDRADIWSMILAHAGNDFLDSINWELSDYGLKLSGCGIHMDENGLWLDLELFYQDIRLVAKVPCALEITGQHISLAPAAVKLGVVPLPVESLLSKVQLDYELTLPLLAEVTQVEFVQDAILVTGIMEQDIRNLVPLDKKLYQTGVFSEAYQPLVDALLNEEGYAALMTHLEQNSGSVEALYRELFVLADPEVAEAYLESRHGMTSRFFPGIDFSAIEAARRDLNEQLTPMTRSLEQFFNTLVSDYNDKKFRLSEGEFLKKNKPFQAETYGGKKYDALFQVLDPDSFFLILVNVEDGFIRKTSSFYRMADE